MPLGRRSYDDVIADSDVDLVYVATHHPAHRDVGGRGGRGRQARALREAARRDGTPTRSRSSTRLAATTCSCRRRSRTACHPQTQRCPERSCGRARSETVRTIDAVFGYDAGPAPTNYLLGPELAGGGHPRRRLLHDVDVAPARAAAAQGVDPSRRSTWRRPRRSVRGRRPIGRRDAHLRGRRARARGLLDRGQPRQRRADLWVRVAQIEIPITVAARVGSADHGRIVVERGSEPTSIASRGVGRVHGRGRRGEPRGPSWGTVVGGDAVGGLPREHADARSMARGDRALVPGDDGGRGGQLATVADVAKRAGVSVSTAARVLSGTGYAADETAPAGARCRARPRLRAEPDRAEPPDAADADDRAPDRRRRELVLLGDREARRGRGEGRRATASSCATATTTRRSNASTSSCSRGCGSTR